MGATLYLLQFMLLEPKRFSGQLTELENCLRTNHRSMSRNPYTTASEKRRLSILSTIVKWKLAPIYRLIYRLYLKTR